MKFLSLPGPNLEKQGILPAETGWKPEKIHSGLDAIILGIHAKDDNPELFKARQNGWSAVNLAFPSKRF